MYVFSHIYDPIIHVVCFLTCMYCNNIISKIYVHFKENRKKCRNCTANRFCAFLWIFFFDGEKLQSVIYPGYSYIYIRSFSTHS